MSLFFTTITTANVKNTEADELTESKIIWNKYRGERFILISSPLKQSAIASLILGIYHIQGDICVRPYIVSQEKIEYIL